jgi:hypothetical protein
MPKGSGAAVRRQHRVLERVFRILSVPGDSLNRCEQPFGVGLAQFAKSSAASAHCSCDQRFIFCSGHLCHHSLLSSR